MHRDLPPFHEKFINIRENYIFWEPLWKDIKSMKLMHLLTLNRKYNTISGERMGFETIYVTNPLKINVLRNKFIIWTFTTSEVFIQQNPFILEELRVYSQIKAFIRRHKNIRRRNYKRYKVQKPVTYKCTRFSDPQQSPNCLLLWKLPLALTPAILKSYPPSTSVGSSTQAIVSLQRIMANKQHTFLLECTRDIMQDEWLQT